MAESMAANEVEIARIEAEAAAKVSQAQADVAMARAETMQVRAELAQAKAQLAAKAQLGAGAVRGDDIEKVRAEYEDRIATMQTSYENEIQALQDEINALRSQIEQVGQAASTAVRT